MKNLRKQTVFIFSLFFLFINNFLSAQSFVNLNNDNLDEVLGYIELNYGNQMQISLDEVASFLIEILEQSDITEDCEPPNPEIYNITPEFISFQWEETPSAIDYEIDYINLYSGETQELTTNNTEADTEANDGLFLFGFQSTCSPELTSSSVNIIIVDKDIMFDGPPEIQDCECHNPTSFSVPVNLFSSSSTLPTASMPWQYTCNKSKYRVSVQSTSGPSYYSEFMLVHDHISAPDIVYFLPMCFNQFTASTSSPVFFGDVGEYFVSFGTSGFRLHFNNFYLAANSIVNIDACNCNPRKIKKEENNAITFKLDYQSKYSQTHLIMILT